MIFPVMASQGQEKEDSHEHGERYCRTAKPFDG